METVQVLIQRIEELLNEVEVYLETKDQLFLEVDQLDAKYQNGHLSYEEYAGKRANLLKEKSKKEWDQQYNTYIYYILKRIENLNSQLFLEAYNDQSYDSLKYIPSKIAASARKTEAIGQLTKPIKPVYRTVKKLIPEISAGMGDGFAAKPEINERNVSKIEGKAVDKKESIPEYPLFKNQDEAEMLGEMPIKETSAKRVQLGELITQKPLMRNKPTAVQKLFGIFKRKTKGDLIQTTEEVSFEEEYHLIFERPQEERFAKARVERPLKAERLNLSQVIEEKKKEKAITGVAKIDQILGINLLRDFLNRMTMSHLKKMKLINQDLRLRYLRTGNLDDLGKSAHISPTLLVREAEHIRKIMEQKRALKLYKPSIIGTMSNLFVRRISYGLISSFPNFFREYYNNLRYSNIKILSNTYVNISVFITLIALFGSLIIYPIITALQGSSGFMILSKTIFMSALTSLAVFMGFYLYPILKTKDRVRSIRTNLPFAINHLAAVSASGIPPNIMFKLIAQTDEYGEICEESRKIDQLITIFGYDLLNAIKSIASTTPSKFFKEFLESMASTVESGGDLQKYLEEKSKEAMIDYELERQKYIESVATYSDIYTGILIAAPLFFVSALSLISVLGGGIGGVSVDLIIAMGTYAVKIGRASCRERV